MNIHSLHFSQHLNNERLLDNMKWLRKGQMFFGKILFIDPETNHALIQINQQKLVANIKAPIDTAREYWFEVIQTGDRVQLKVLEHISNDSALLNYLKLPHDNAIKRLSKNGKNGYSAE